MAPSNDATRSLALRLLDGVEERGHRLYVIDATPEEDSAPPASRRTRN